MSNNLNFMIHCGGKEVERSQLALVKTPEATRSFQPVPHDDFVNMVEDELNNVGLYFQEQVHALNKEGQQYFGMARVVGDSLIENDSWSTVVGFRGSHDKTLSRGVVFGDGVFVCDNLCFSGEVQLGRKHTANIMRDLRPLIQGAVVQVAQRAEVQQVRYERYQRARLTDSCANHAIIQMLKKGIINTQRVEKVVSEYYEPSHDEHLINGQKTIWTLHNAATEALKGCGLSSLPSRTIKLQGLMDQATDYALAA